LKVVGFRVDVAKHIGTGHVQRCLTLAHELEKLLISSIFFVREHDKQLLKLISDNGFIYHIIGKSSIEYISENHSHWLGVSQKQDAEEFFKSIIEQPIDALVIDHYSIDYVWENIIKSSNDFPIVVIDDLANRKHSCDLLVDQNYWPNFNQRYKDLVPKSCECLLGPKYAMLKPRFLNIRESRNSESSKGNKILVNFGGIGNFEVLKKFIPIFQVSTNFNFHIVTGRLPENEYIFLTSLVDKLPHIYIEESTACMPELMSISDYCIGACGSTVWERFCLGLNSGLIDIAENQRDLINYLLSQNLIDYIGSYSSLTPNEIKVFIHDLSIHDKEQVLRKERIQFLVDGKGATRVAKKIKEL